MATSYRCEHPTEFRSLQCWKILPGKRLQMGSPALRCGGSRWATRWDGCVTGWWPAEVEGAQPQKLGLNPEESDLTNKNWFKSDNHPKQRRAWCVLSKPSIHPHSQWSWKKKSEKPGKTYMCSLNHISSHPQLQISGRCLRFSGTTHAAIPASKRWKVVSEKMPGSISPIWFQSSSSYDLWLVKHC
jgi:hypothetical protein